MMDPIRIGIVGLNFGRQMIQHLQSAPANRHFQLVAVCDQNEKLSRNLGREAGVAAFVSLDQLLAESSVDAVGVFTGPHRRAGLLRRCISADKHVITTKPFEFSVKEAKSVLAEARARQRVIQLNSPGPVLTAEMRRINTWREQHDLGRLVGLRGESWGSYFERTDGTWYDDPVRCPLAPILRLGVYLINDMVTLAGPPREIQAMHSRVRTRRPTVDNALLNLKFAGDALGSIYASLCVDDGQPYQNSLVLNYERGTIRRNMGPAPGDLSARSRLTLCRPDAKERFVIQKARLSELSGDYQWVEFARTVREGRGLDPRVEAAILDGVSVVEHLARAARTGKMIKFNDRNHLRARARFPASA